MRRRNRGFTLVEVVIAVAIAVLVSVAAAAVIISTRTATKNAKDKNNAVSYANNIMESFKSSRSFNQFKKGLEFTFFDAVKNNEGELERNRHFRFDSEADWISGDTFYLYLNDNGTLTSDENSVNTEWNADNTKACRYVVAVKISDCGTGNAILARTKLNVAVYLVTSQYTSKPDISNADNDANVVYYSEYTKGVTD